MAGVQSLEIKNASLERVAFPEENEAYRVDYDVFFCVQTHRHHWKDESDYNTVLLGYR